MQPDGGDGQPLIMSYLAMRKCVGGIGVLLPLVLLAGNEIIGYGVQPSRPVQESPGWLRLRVISPHSGQHPWSRQRSW